MKYFKLASIAVAAALFALPAQATSVLSINGGLVLQANVLTQQNAQTNTLGFLVAGNTVVTQGAGNAVQADLLNDSSFLVANGAAVGQLNFLTQQNAQSNTLGFLVLGNDISTLAVGNSVGASLTNTNSLLAANGVVTGQLNLLTQQNAQTNTVGVVVAGNTISTGAIGNSVSVSMTNN